MIVFERVCKKMAVHNRLCACYTVRTLRQRKVLLLMETELLTPEEAAVYLRLNPQTAYRLLRTGQLPGVKIGRQWRIRKSSLDAYLDSQRRDPAPA